MEKSQNQVPTAIAKVVSAKGDLQVRTQPMAQLTFAIQNHLC